jgi:hypothetical protein
MDPRVVVTISDMARLRERNLTVCQTSVRTIVLSQEARTRSRAFHHLIGEAQARSVATRRKSIIARKLRERRLPHTGAATIAGGPGQDGACDGCGDPLTPKQLVMEVPSSEKSFVHLHADCFMIWNALRPRGGRLIA